MKKTILILSVFFSFQAFGMFRKLNRTHLKIQTSWMNDAKPVKLPIYLSQDDFDIMPENKALSSKVDVCNCTAYWSQKRRPNRIRLQCANGDRIESVYIDKRFNTSFDKGLETKGAWSGDKRSCFFLGSRIWIE